MASGAYSRGILKILDGTIDVDTSTLKAVLVKSTYPFDPDQAFVDDGSANDIQSHEADATGYTGGFGGAGRKTLTVTLTEQTANNRVVVKFNDLTWTALGGATNNTLGGVCVVREITNDAASFPIAFLDFTDVATNGGDVTVDFDNVDGNIRFAV